MEATELGTQKTNRRYCTHLFLLCILQFFGGVFYLGHVPRIYMDEAWDASLGCEFAKTGVLRHPFVQNFGGMDVYFIQPRVVLPIVCAGVFKVVYYSIVSSRLPSLFLSVLAIFILYHIARRFFGDRQSFFICLATILSIWFWLNSRRCRPEIYCVVLSLLFLWLVISYFRSNKAMAAFFAGVIAALTAITHPNGVIAIIAISLSWLMWKEKTSLLKFILWALAGFCLAILPYILYAFWANRQPGVSFSSQIQMDFLGNSWVNREVMRWRTFFQLPFGIPVALVMFAGWLAAWRKSTVEDKFAATAIALYAILLPFLSVNGLPDYLVLIVPFFSIVVVRMIFRIDELIGLNGTKKLYAIQCLLAFIYIIYGLAPAAIILYKHHKADFGAVIDKAAKVVGSNAKISADPSFWIGHGKYIYGPYLIVQQRDFLTTKDILQWAYSQSFDYAIRTSWDNNRISQLPKKLPDKVSDSRLVGVTDYICEKFGTKVSEFYDEYYGPVEIYKLDWSTAWKFNLKKQIPK